MLGARPHGGLPVPGGGPGCQANSRGFALPESVKSPRSQIMDDTDACSATGTAPTPQQASYLPLHFFPPFCCSPPLTSLSLFYVFLRLNCTMAVVFISRRVEKKKKRDWWAGERLATAFNDGWMRNEEINYMEDSVQITFSGFKHLSFNLNFSQVILSDLKKKKLLRKSMNTWTEGWSWQSWCLFRTLPICLQGMRR